MFPPSPHKLDSPRCTSPESSAPFPTRCHCTIRSCPVPESMCQTTSPHKPFEGQTATSAKKRQYRTSYSYTASACLGCQSPTARCFQSGTQSLVVVTLFPN